MVEVVVLHKTVMLVAIVRIYFRIHTVFYMQEHKAGRAHVAYSTAPPSDLLIICLLVEVVVAS